MATDRQQIMAQDRKSFPKPLYLLKESYGRPATKCYCSECEKVSDINMDDMVNRYSLVSGCPECGNMDMTLEVQKSALQHGDFVINGKSYIHNGQEGWKLPETVTGRYLYVSMDTDTGDVQKIEDNIMTKSVIIFPNGKIMSMQSELGETTDLQKNNATVSRTNIAFGQRDKKVFRSHVDTFAYPDNSVGEFTGNESNKTMGVKGWGVNHAHAYNANGTSSIGFLEHNKLIDELCRQHRSDGRVITPANSKGNENYFTAMMNALGNTPTSEIMGEKAEANSEMPISLFLSRLKTQMISSRFKDLDPMYLDFYNNGLFLAEHHVGSNEGNTPLSRENREIYTMMMLRYPLAFEYACERTDARIRTWYEDQKGKQRREGIEPTDDIEISAAYKNKIFREEVELVAQSVAAADDIILTEIKKAKSLDELKKNLMYNVFGEIKPEDQIIMETEASSVLRLTAEDENGKAIPIQPSLGARTVKTIKNKQGETEEKITPHTSLIKYFNKNMITTASNVYTAMKMGYTSYADKLLFVKKGEEYSPSLEEKRKKVNGQTIRTREKASLKGCAGALPPLTRDGEIAFARNVGAELNANQLLDKLLGEKNDRQALIDTQNAMKMYTVVIRYGQAPKNKEEAKQFEHIFAKKQLIDYIEDENSSIQDAYFDFIDKYGEKTESKINSLLFEIAYDKKLDEMKRVYDKDGLDAMMEKYKDSTLSHFPPYNDSTKETKKQYEENPKKYIKNYFDNYKLPENRKTIFYTRNREALFTNRTIKQMIEELDIMVKHSCKREPIEYTEEEKKFARICPALPDQPDGPKYKFRLPKNTQEIVELGSQMSNCVSGYATRARDKQCLIMYMCDETHQPLICIELQNRRGEWEINQLLGHGNQIDRPEFSDAVEIWRKACNLPEHRHTIEFKNKKQQAIADGRYEDIIRPLREQTPRREKKSREVYGTKEDTNEINLPNPPEMPDWLQLEETEHQMG